MIGRACLEGVWQLLDPFMPMRSRTASVGETLNEVQKSNGKEQKRKEDYNEGTNYVAGGVEANQGMAGEKKTHKVRSTL